MIQERFESIYTDSGKDLEKKNYETGLRMTYRYTLGTLHPTTFRKKLSEIIGREHFDQIRALLVNTDYCVRCFWKAFYDHIGGGVSAIIASDTHEVDIQDILRAKELVPIEEQGYIKKYYSLYNTSTYLSDDEIMLIMKSVKNTVNLLTFKKLSFLTNDFYTESDLQGELLAEAIKLIKYYEGLPEKHLINSVKKGIHNYAMRIIEFRTARCRNRLNSEIGKTTLSLDQENEDEQCLYDTVSSQEKNPLENMEAKEFLDGLMKDSPERIKVLYLIIEREYPENFIRWMRKTYKITPDVLDIQNLAWYGCCWMGLHMDKVKNILRNILPSYINI